MGRDAHMLMEKATLDRMADELIFYKIQIYVLLHSIYKVKFKLNHWISGSGLGLVFISFVSDRSISKLVTVILPSSFWFFFWLIANGLNRFYTYSSSFTGSFAFLLSFLAYAALSFLCDHSVNLNFSDWGIFLGSYS